MINPSIRGFGFPFRIDAASGGIGWAADEEKIRQNILLVLGTRLAERPMLRNFGTRIPSLVHDPNDDVLAELVQNEAREALVQWEPRILVTNTRVERVEGELRVWLDYVYTDRGVTDRLMLPIR